MLTSTSFYRQESKQLAYTNTNRLSLEYANTDRHTHKHLCSCKKCPDLPVLDVSPGFFTAVVIVGMCVGRDTSPLAPFDWELDSCILKVDT